LHFILVVRLFGGRKCYAAPFFGKRYIWQEHIKGANKWRDLGMVTLVSLYLDLNRQEQINLCDGVQW
jgi:hypothetical protein